MITTTVIWSISNSNSIRGGLKSFMLKNCKVDFLGNSKVAFTSEYRAEVCSLWVPLVGSAIVVVNVVDLAFQKPLTSRGKFINCSKQLKYSPKVYVIILQFLGTENGNSRRNEPDIFCQCRLAVLARIRKLGVRIGHFWAMVTDEYPLGARDGCIFSAIPLSLGIVCILKLL
jgi:hypothetical protein